MRTWFDSHPSVAWLLWFIAAVFLWADALRMSHENWQQWLSACLAVVASLAASEWWRKS